MSVRFFHWLLACLVLLAGCTSPGKRPPITSQKAYIGPISLQLYGQLGPNAKPVAKAAHGEPADILQVQRAFVKIRTRSGAEGWTNIRQLLDASQMESLQRLAEYAAKRPSQGTAGIFSTLNIHTEPYRQAPSFYQVKEGEKVEVLLRRLMPRVAYEPKQTLLPKEPKKKPAKRPSRDGEKDDGKAKQGKLERALQPPPASLAPPKLPGNWLDLSGPGVENPEMEPEIDDAPSETVRTEKQSRNPPRAAVSNEPPLDEWMLVRTKSGNAGWVLAGRLLMAIPDAVAQYAEGHRIMAYFSLGDVTDHGETRHHWLWTTSSQPRQPWDFDSFRVFIWSVSRHRYETAHIERNLKGYYPVEVQPVKVTEGKKEQNLPGFTLILEDSGGTRSKRTYAFQGYRVRMIASAAWQAPAEAEPWRVEAPKTETPAAEAKSLFQKSREKIGRLFSR